MNILFLYIHEVGPDLSRFVTYTDRKLYGETRCFLSGSDKCPFYGKLLDTC